jgi:predicted nucleotidyltransferase
VRTDRPGQSALLLLDAVDILRSEGVDYLVIGAFALSVHGVVRGTTDVDALLYISERRLAKLRDLFKKAGFGAVLRRGNADDPIPIMLALTDPHNNRVDLLGGLRGLDPQVFSRAVDVPFLGENLRVVGREDFIAMKCFAGGPQDIVDARSAYLAAQGPVDLELLRAVARRFGRDASNRLEHLLSGF